MKKPKQGMTKKEFEASKEKWAKEISEDKYDYSKKKFNSQKFKYYSKKKIVTELVGHHKTGRFGLNTSITTIKKELLAGAKRFYAIGQDERGEEISTLLKRIKRINKTYKNVSKKTQGKMRNELSNIEYDLGEIVGGKSINVVVDSNITRHHFIPKNIKLNSKYSRNILEQKKRTISNEIVFNQILAKYKQALESLYVDQTTLEEMEKIIQSNKYAIIELGRYEVLEDIIKGFFPYEWDKINEIIFFMKDKKVV